MCVDAPRKRLLAVRETHDPERSEPENALVAIGFDGATSVWPTGRISTPPPGFRPMANGWPG
jgi:hypothetical protein